MPLAVYVLACRGNNYYVGVADNVEAAYMEHYMGVGSEWTRLHTPIRVERVIPDAESYDESALLRHYFLLHGVDRVRGGPYTTVVLTEAQKTSLAHLLGDADELMGAFANIALTTEACARCGGSGHRAKLCMASHDINCNEIQSEGEYSDFEMS